jgi:hypothetical protein
VNSVFEPNELSISPIWFNFWCFSKMRPNHPNQFGSDTLIGLQRFFFHKVFPTVIFCETGV